MAAEHLHRAVRDLERDPLRLLLGERGLPQRRQPAVEASAASHASSRAPSISIAISASLKAIACLVAIGAPNACRCLA